MLVARRLRTPLVIGLCGAAVAFDGYDLGVYGTTVSALMDEWGIGPAEAGRLASSALVGMLLGSLLAGSLAGRLGRRRTLIGGLTAFSLLTAACAAAQDPGTFMALRFLTGLGLGAVLPAATALTIEYAPARRRNLTYMTMQSGYAVGGILAAALAIRLVEDTGWRVMYLIGAAPLVLVVPLALRYLPESVEHLVARGRLDEARALAARLGRPVPAAPAPAAPEPIGHAGARALFTGGLTRRTLLFWTAAFAALLLVYGMNTWLPELMREAGYPLGSALSFLLVFNLGSIAGSLPAGRLADAVGSKYVVVGSFVLGALCVALLSVRGPVALTYVLVAVSGFGAIGTMNLLNAHVTRSYPAAVRATGIGWSLGVGRLGGILGPSIGGLLLGSDAGIGWSFALFAVVAAVGAVAVFSAPAPPRGPR
ncbi:aromatic acid/H+ symport family MFS transporter [Streptomyces sp. CRN 30]|uniref:MFS transporter n=1 Tax=Streptomyces sp. CRN 30 TaxID=3075613 RepID=UPI002A82723B|nr:aromatic acid/H+ symport family MFS transporter [Streptomyces sp. CRN 30]